MGSTPLGGCRGFFWNFLFKFPFSHKRFQMGKKWILINCTSCNGSPQKIPFQFANGKLPHSRCRGFWAVCFFVNLEVYLTTLSSKIFCFSDFFSGTGRDGTDGTDRQTDKQADKQTDRHTDRQTFLGKYYFRYVLNITLKTFQESLMKNLLKIETIPQTLKLFIKTRLSVK